MAENLNTLYYALGLDDHEMQQGLKKAIDNLSVLDEEFNRINKAIEDTFGKKMKDTPIHKEIKGVTARLRELEKQWKDLEAEERRGQKGDYIRLKYKLAREEAGNLNNSLARLYSESQKAASGQKGLAAQFGLVNKELTLQSRLMSNVKTLFTTYVSIFAVKSFIQNLAQVRGEFELQQISLRAILRDAEAADRIFSQIKSFAVISPFEFKDLVSYAKQLSAFQVPVNELFETTKRLADVSAGLGVGMDRIILAYGQVRSAAVLRGQELRQFTEAGIPLVDELAKKFSELEGRVVSAGDVFEKISNRMVSFEMVKEIFEDMTNEGGMFYRMQEKQAESLKGKIANLADAYDIMLNDIGQANDGILKGGVEGIAALMRNWQEVWNILKAIIVAYGTYNTALIINNSLTSKLAVNTALLQKAQASLAISTNGLTASRVGALRVLAAATAANNGYAAATAKAALSNNIFSRSFYKLSASVSANPVIAMLGAFAALAVVSKNVYDGYLDDLSSAEKANERVANSMAALNSEFTAQKKQFNELSKIVKDQTILIDTQNKSFVELKQIYPDLFNNLQTEEQWYKAVSEANEKRNKAIIKMKELFPDIFKGLNTEKDIVNSLTKAYENLNRAHQEQMLAKLEADKKNIEISIQRIKKATSGINYGGETGIEAFRVQTAQLQGLENQYKSINAEINNIKKSLKDTIEFEEGWRQQIKDIAPNLYDNQQLKDFKNLSEILDDLRTKLEKYKQSEIDYKNIPASKKTAQTIREYNSLKNNISQAEAALKLFNAVLKKNNQDPNAERLKEQIDLIKKAQAQYEKYLQIMSPDEALNAIRTDQQFVALEIQFEPDKVRERLQMVMNEIGKLTQSPELEKLKKSIQVAFTDIDYTESKKNFDQFLKDLTKEIDSYKGKYDIYKELLNLTGNEQLAIELSFGANFEGLPNLSTYIADQIKEVAAKVFKIDLKFDINNKSSIREQIGDLYNTLPDTLKKQVDKLDEIREDEAENTVKMYAKNLAEFGNMEQRKLAIAAKYAKQIQAARDMGDEDVAKKLEGQKELELLRLTDNYIGFFSFIEAMSRETANTIHTTLRNQLDQLLQAGKLSIEEYAKAVEAIDAQMAKKTNEKSFGETYTNDGLDGILSKIQSLGKANELQGISTKNEKMEQLGKNMQMASQKAMGAMQVVDMIVTNIHNGVVATQQLINSINELRDSKGLDELGGTKYFEVLSEFDKHAASGWEKLKSGDIAGAVSETAQSYISILTSFNKIHDRKYDKRIKESQKEVKRLTNAYQDLERAIDKALGEDVYKVSGEQIQNLQKQQKELLYQIDQERAKKNTDKEKVKDLQRQVLELNYEIEDLLENLKNDIIGGTAKDIAQQLGNAFFDAFAQGENAAKAWEDTVNDIIGNIVRNMLISKFIEKPVQDAINNLYAEIMPGASKAEEINKKIQEARKELEEIRSGKSGLSKREAKAKEQRLEALINRFQQELSSLDVDSPILSGEAFAKFGDILSDLGSGFEEIVNNLPDDIKKYLFGDEGGKGLSEGIKSVTEDTAQLLASYMNAIRGSVLLQEMYMKSIDTNVAGIYQAMGGNPNTATTATLPPEILAAISEPFKLNNSLLASIEAHAANTHSIAANALAQLIMIQANTYNMAIEVKRSNDYLASVIRAGHPNGGYGINVFA